jgi:hypothetical protein
MKRVLKVPMILFALMAGLSGGIYNQFIRGFLLQVSHEGAQEMMSTYLYAVIGVGGAVFKLVLVNWAMTIYEQGEIGPIFSAFFIVFQISAGAFIENEKELYTFKEMVLLLLYSLICILGIFLIARKELMPFIQNKVIFGQDKSFK